MAKTKLTDVPASDSGAPMPDRRAPSSNTEEIKKWVRRELALAAGGVNEAHREEMNP